MSELSRLGRKVGSVKSKEKKQEEYKQVLKELKRGTSIGEPPNCVMFQLAPFRDKSRNLDYKRISRPPAFVIGIFLQITPSAQPILLNQIL